MYDILTIRLPSGAEAPDFAMIDEVATRHGMSRSQWVRSLIVRELKAHGDAPERPGNAELRAYARAASDEAMFEAHRQFEREHPSARDAHLRPRAPKIPAAMRIRVSLDAHEAIALESAGKPYAMSIQQVAATVIARWVGLNKKPPAPITLELGSIRAQIKRIGANVNQIATAANRLLLDQRFRRQDELSERLAEIKDCKAGLDDAMRQISMAMGLERKHWTITDKAPAERHELLPDPSVQQEYVDDDPA